ncbi:MAG: response regulator [Armatimonadota bacterium]
MQESDDREARNPSILIVEDHAAIRTMLLDWLSMRFPEFAILAAQDGQTGIAMACRERPVVIIMDIRLPDISGLEATRQIKAAMPAARVIVLTGFDQPEYRRDAEKAGASAFVLKSQASTELLPAIQSLLTHRDPIGTNGAA